MAPQEKQNKQWREAELGQLLEPEKFFILILILIVDDFFVIDLYILLFYVDCHSHQNPRPLTNLKKKANT